MYPTIDWSSVTFHHGIPWIMQVSSPVAITLPGTLQLHQIHIYFRDDLDVCSCVGLGIPVHEALHVVQYRDLLGGWGLGYLRAFIVAYISCGITQGGGTGNVIEDPAYEQENAFVDCCSRQKERVCDCSTKPPSFNQGALDALFAACPNLVRTSSGIDFWGAIAACTPLTPWLAPLWFIVALIATILAAILKPIVELVLLIVDGLLWVVTGIVCLAEAFWQWLQGVLVGVCDWATDLEQRCIDWQTTRERRCAEERDLGYNRCDRTADQGYQQCTATEDRGYQRCDREEDQGYRDCCTWWPCSWACNAWVWVSHVVCVAWTWVSNVVCVAWTWVSHVVCVAWTWVSNVVCVAWTWIVSRTCRAFTWVVKGVTCWAR